NMRTFEAAAGGALLFQEEGNHEVPQFLRPGEEYVAFTPENFETVLAYYLDHEEERRKIAEQARKRVECYSFESLWDESLAQIDAAWSNPGEPTIKRCAFSREERLRL